MVTLIDPIMCLFPSAAKKSILRDRRDFWCVLELVEKFVPEAAQITATVRDMPHLKYASFMDCLFVYLSICYKQYKDVIYLWEQVFSTETFHHSYFDEHKI